MHFITKKEERSGGGRQVKIEGTCVHSWLIHSVVWQKSTGHCKKIQFSSVRSVKQSCPNLCDPTDCSMPGLPVHHQLLEFTETHIRQAKDAIQPSHPVIPFSSCLQSFPVSGSFPLSQFFASGGERIGVSASASVLPMNNQD